MDNSGWTVWHYAIGENDGSNIIDNPQALKRLLVSGSYIAQYLKLDLLLQAYVEILRKAGTDNSPGTPVSIPFAIFPNSKRQTTALHIAAAKGRHDAVQV